jgi:nucleoid-associated protein YgaU
MKKTLILVLVLSAFLCGCTGMQLQNPFAPKSPVSSQPDSEPAVSQTSGGPYLARGSTVSATSDREDRFGTVSEGSSPAELRMQIVDFQDKLAKEQRRRETAEQELKAVQREFGQRFFDMQNELLKARKESEDIRAKAAESEVALIKSTQELERAKIDMMQKKSMVDSQYPAFYEVQKGDSLWKIAAMKNIYSDPYKWMEIYAANKDKIEDPGVIYPGQVLKIPRYYNYLFAPPPSSEEEALPAGGQETAPGAEAKDMAASEKAGVPDEKE